MQITETFTEADWQALLAPALVRPVEVHYGRARRNVIVARYVGQRLVLRLNHHFADAPPDVRDAVLAWLRSGRRARRACQRLDGWIAELEERLAKTPPRRARLDPRGEHHDLEELLKGVLASESDLVFAPEPVPDITWGRRGKRPARRSLQLGSYDPERRLVRINRVLDQPAVPRFFLRYVIFHELLHGLIGNEREGDGRRAHHGPRFRARERAFGDYERAVHWQEAHVGKLLASLRTGKPLAVRAPRPKRSAWPMRIIQNVLFPAPSAQDAASGETRAQPAETGR